MAVTDCEQHKIGGFVLLTFSDKIFNIPGRNQRINKSDV